MIPKHDFKIALAQLTSIDDEDFNARKVEDFLQQLPTENRPDLVVFPENTLYLKLQKQVYPGLELSHEIFQRLQSLCSDCGLTAMLTTPVREGAHVVNATVLLGAAPGPQILYRKIHLFDVDVVGEKSVRESEQFVGGRAPAVFEHHGWKIGLSICYDVRFSELYQNYARQGVHLILVPSAFLVATGKAHWHLLCRARAVESQAFVVAPAQSGLHRRLGDSSGAERSTFGHSLVVDPWGEVLVDVENAGPSLVQVHLERQRLERVRQQIPMAHHRRL